MIVRLKENGSRERMGFEKSFNSMIVRLKVWEDLKWLKIGEQVSIL